MKERFLEWKHSIQGKLLAYFTILFLLVISSMIVFYRISINNIYETATEAVKNTIRQVNTDTDRVLTNALDQAQQVARDVDIQTTLRAPLPNTEHELYGQRVRYNYILYDRNRLLEDINGIFVIGDNGAIYRSTRYGLRENVFREREWYAEVMESGEVLWMPPHAGSIIVNNLDESTISVAVPIKDRASTKILGVVVAEIRTEQLKQVKESGLVFEGTTYLLDKNNKIIYTSSDESLQETLAISRAVAESASASQAWTKDIKIKGGKYLVSVAELSDSGWKIMGLISYEEMYAKAEILRNSIFIVMGAFAMIAIAFAIIGSNQISKPIREIRTTMKKVEKGNFNVHVEYTGKDEVGELARSFNHMVHKIIQLMEREQENQKKLRQAEFKALQSQINPHFLYNTLDSITWMVRMNRLEKLEDMITSLTSFLRIGLSRGRSEITFEEELKHVENYVAIQKIRYAKLLNYEVDVPEEFKKYYVIKMILQPIVENALYGLGISIKKGEVLGLAGLLGSGRTELGKVLFGAVQPDEGTVFWMGKEQRFKNAKDAIILGMGFCTEDRKVEGIIPHLSVRENMTIALLPQISKMGIVSAAKQKQIVDDYIKRLSIKTPSQNQPIRNLSGGNQQKVLLARWLCMNPKLIIMDEPTRGIDVGAKAEIEELILGLASQGISILMISSEIAELERNCDRVVVMREGCKLGELLGDDIHQDKVMEIIASGGGELESIGGVANE